MQQVLANENIKYIVGDENILADIDNEAGIVPFADIVINFLATLSELLRKDSEARKYSDIQTFAFWCRKASVIHMREAYSDLSNRFGRGVTFHIAPSNIPMMFMFSLGVSLLAGNSNIIRLASREFPQTKIVCDIMNSIFSKNYNDIKRKIVIMSYPHDYDITKKLSSLCSTRIIWGGNNSIQSIRSIPLPPYSIELPFYDRFSFAVIQADEYLKAADKRKIADNFYNDTYFTDQNACTSPQLLIWLGDQVDKAKKIFWKEIKEIVDKKYDFQPVQGIDKLAAACKYAIDKDEGQLIYDSMCICRMEIKHLYEDLKKYRCPGGYFYEYTANDLADIAVLCKRECQTISYYGLKRINIETVIQNNHCQGVDRIVPIGMTMDFGLIWDGFDFIYSLTRRIG